MKHDCVCFRNVTDVSELGGKQQQYAELELRRGSNYTADHSTTPTPSSGAGTRRRPISAYLNFYLSKKVPKVRKVVYHVATLGCVSVIQHCSPYRFSHQDTRSPNRVILGYVEITKYCKSLTESFNGDKWRCNQYPRKASRPSPGTMKQCLVFLWSTGESALRRIRVALRGPRSERYSGCISLHG